MLCSFISMQESKAQNSIYSGFENAPVPAPPPGWKVENTGHAKWQSLKNTGEGGNAYAGLKCMYLANSFFGDQSDAWLISPAMQVEAGKKYSISFYYKNQVDNANRLEVTIGNDTTAASQTVVIWKNKFTTTYYTEAQINYTATETGTKYFALHCTTPTTYTYLYVDNFLAREVSTFESPDLQISEVTTTSAHASWKRIGAAAQYLYGYSETMSPPANPMTTSSTDAILTGLQPATKYYLYVKTLGKNGIYSSWAIKQFSSAYDTANIETLACGERIHNGFKAIDGLYLNVICEKIYFGKEFFHKFIPSQSGYYNFNVIAVNTGQTMEFAYKDASLGAGPEDWNCIGSGFGDFGGKATFGPLVAGKEYLILEKPLASPGYPSSYMYQVECYNPPPVNDNCDQATEIIPAPYNDTTRGVRLTTLGGTKSNLAGNYNVCGYGVDDDDIWIKFTATADIQLFRIQGMNYKDYAFPLSNPGIYFDIFDQPCNLKKSVDCGYIQVDQGTVKDFFSYKLKKGTTYYARIFTADQTTYANFKLSIMDLDVAKGAGNSCTPISPYPIDEYTDGDNRNILVPFTDASYKLIAQVNAKGNTLNQVEGGMYRNSSALRKDKNGVYYLDRTVTLNPGKQPGSPVIVRIIIPNSELQKLIDKPGSGVNSIKDIRVTQNNDDCASAFTKHATAFITPSFAGDYDANNKVIKFEAAYLSTYYLHGGNKALVALPGLAGKAAVTSVPVNETAINIFPNPFKENFTLIINENTNCKYNFMITDMQGKTLQAVEKQIVKGVNTVSFNCKNVPAGMYVLKIQTAGKIEYRKLIKL